MSEKKTNKGLFVFIAVIVIAIILAAASLVLSLRSPAEIKINTSSEDSGPAKIIRTFRDTKNIPYGKKYIARLEIKGTICESGDTYNQKWLLNTISALAQDKKNEGIILFIDSPGGGVYESDEAYLALLDYKEQTGRPVYAYMGQLAASGGYYIACAADYIMANRNTLTGSIGVISGQVFDITDLLQKSGIKSETIHAGKNKNMGNFNEPFSSEQRQIMQSVADECYEQFTNIVSESRSLPIEKVKSLADGRIYTAKQAKENGLIDETGTFSEIESAMKENELDGTECVTQTFRFEKKENIYNMITGIYHSAETLAEVLSGTGAQSALKDKNGLPLYYYSR